MSDNEWRIETLRSLRRAYLDLVANFEHQLQELGAGPSKEVKWATDQRLEKLDLATVKFGNGATLRDYLDAPAGVGPLAREWDDKPHELFYDLIRRIYVETATRR